MINNELIKNFSGIFPESGCDEAGRGCLAGPVVAAAVILPETRIRVKWNDSKLLRPTERNEMRAEILESALAWAVGISTVEEIDQMNILNASILAMHRAIENLSIKPAFIIVDGNRFKPFQSIPYSCKVKGDSIFLSIAAASILAKTTRDELMENLHLQFSEYRWNQNKGYPTKAHRKAIETFGACKHHRKSFRLLNTQQKINWS
jgi:ribonuclease HII